MDARIRELKERAEAGDADAQHRFGTVNLYGVIYNPDAGIGWYQKAAKQGHVGAMKSLAIALSGADDIRHDKVESLRLALELADQGDAEMQVFAAKLCLGGRGVDPDLKKAYELTLGAAERGYVPAQELMGEMLEKGLGAESDSAGAVRWYEKAVEGGSVGAVGKLNNILEGSGKAAINAFYVSRAYEASGVDQSADLGAKKNSSLGM